MSGILRAEQASIVVKVAGAPKAISPDLFGIFFEDINFAADGGLYAELVRNRSFDFDATENVKWNALTGWELLERKGRGAVSIDDSWPIHPNNAKFAVLEVFDPGEGVGIANDGFDGIAVKEGEQYNFSMFARHLYSNNRWGPRQPDELPPLLPAFGEKPGPVVVRIESKAGEVLAETSLGLPGKEWTKLSATLKPSRTDNDARLVVMMTVKGGIALDMVSLFPAKTFRNRPNGLRADLAEAITDLKPRFIRFPGGCLVHGNGVPNMYRWKDTIGPVETRRGQANLWRYHQSMGLGYFEYFQFCEDIGAKPLPVVPAGVSCQNSGFTGGTGQRSIPMEEMPAYVQEVLDLIEWANGPADSTWGAKRAEAGHPEPFGLEYLGVGNEEHITPAFEERFRMIHDAIKAKYPEITVIGTTGPSHSGEDYDRGWSLARGQQLRMVDEHYYVSTDWFWDHLDFYDKYDRSGPAVYLGEYAAHDHERKSTLRSALSEAAYLTSLERNGDIVRLASYAPLLGKQGRTQWRPDLIYFDNTLLSPTINYDVQKLFSHYAGDQSIPLSLGGEASTFTKDGKRQLALSCVRQGSDVILKIVSRSKAPIRLRLDIESIMRAGVEGEWVTLSGDLDAENVFGQPPVVASKSVPWKCPNGGEIEILPCSLNVIRVKGE